MAAVFGTKQRQQRSGWLCLLAGLLHLLAPLCPACPALTRTPNRLLTVTATPASGSTLPAPCPTLARAYTYDNAGKLLTVTETPSPISNLPSAALSVSYTYDAMGRVTAESSRGQVHHYEYDLAGNRVKATYSTGRIVETSYDGLNRPEAIVDGDRLTRYGYDKAGRAVILIAANGQTSSNTYDALGRLTDRVLYKSPAMDPAQRLAQFAWEHDLLGNVTQQEEIWPGEATRAAGVRRTTMGYDDNNRLTSETISHPTEGTQSTTYTYDDANNRTSKTVTGGAESGHWDYDYNAANQLTAWEHLDYPGGSVLRSASLTYDDAGNRTSQAVTQISGTYNPTYNPQPAVSGLTTYTWDAQDRLASVTLPDGSTHRYEYDYRTRRVGTSELQAPSSTPQAAKHTAITFSGGLSVAEWETTSSPSLPVSSSPSLASPPTVEYTRGPDMGGGVGGLLYTSRSESTSSSRTLRYNLSNGRGDIVAQADQYASLTWTASYEAYGKRTKETGENKDKQRGNSKDEDPTGLLNEGFRYRDIETGVWLSRDPAGFVDGPNLYAYVMQNPWSAYDPHGLDHLLVVGGVRTLPEQGAHVRSSDQHDKTPNNFTNAAIRNAKEIASGGGNVTIFIHKSCYDKRGTQDGKVYTDTAEKRAADFNKANPSAGKINVAYYNDKKELRQGIEASAQKTQADSFRYYGHQGPSGLLINYGEASGAGPHPAGIDPPTKLLETVTASEVGTSLRRGTVASNFETKSYGCNSDDFAKAMTKEVGRPAMGSIDRTDYSNVGGHPDMPNADSVPTSAGGYVHYDKNGNETKRDAPSSRPSNEPTYKRR